MTTTILTLLILYGVYRWSISWIEYYSKLDSRLGSSVWRYSYDYHVPGERDTTLDDDEKLVILRRKRNRAVTIMYSIVFLSFIILMSFVSQILLIILT